MLDVTLSLVRVQCNGESDWGGAEPYLWTVFFYSDLTTIQTSGGLMATHTPHQNSTTRGMYPNGITSGDDFQIPPAMGEFAITLDGGGLGLSLVGCLFVLMDERNTDADAIKAGHFALGAAAHEALNDLAAVKVLEDDRSPTTEEAEAVAKHIEGSVRAAIREKLSWYDYLDQQDRYVGAGFKTFSEEQMADIADGGGGDAFVAKIRAERVITNTATGLGGAQPKAVTLIDDYDVFGALRVREATSVPDPSDPERERFREAVSAFKAVQAQIARLRDDLPAAKDTERQELYAQLEYTRRFTRLAAVQALERTREAYEAKRRGLHHSDQAHSARDNQSGMDF